ncbi:xanthine/uracil permease [Vagococcus penaei]|uniref:Xanthine/uracil permease n=1 Tax=Vagococcus penaei TaxID=633807 RepID=A0A1Q2D4K2_9ENTE|nr:solute carrier family 23 protein [Vagococcus penaei]AQP53205.1 xanthine/uracil permease [Vagococcus penaei]RSU01007.1 xanthine/uracil permease [Vagococcus penaei]
MEKSQATTKLTIGVNDHVSTGQAILLGIQHVLAMDVYVVPFLIAAAVSMSAKDSSSLIQATFIAAGIGTFIQTFLFMKLPIAQGPSFIPIGAIIGIYFANQSGDMGWGTVLGASLIGAIIVTLLGLSGLFHKFVASFIPPIVGGTIIYVVGLSLMPVAMTGNVFNAPGKITDNLLMAIITATTLITLTMLGSRFPVKGRWLRVSSVIIALVVGSFVAKYLGVLDLSAVNQASAFSIPRLPFINFGLHFDLSAIVTMVIIYMVLLAETTGTWFAISQATESDLSPETINRGVIGEGISCIVSALVGSTPVTGYSTNAGIISITGVASKKVFAAAGIWFVIFGFSGKLATLISSIPSAVIGGVFVVVCGVIAISGMQVIKEVPIREKEMYVISVPMIVTLGLILIPQDFITTLPQFLQYLFGSPIATASIVAIILNKVLPSER